ncbi:hypothetical protein [Mucilaginibacter psychrotolerans]|uniref:Uncharacterized protein n=1 Tax=Mucilaginibacter psychrotolerans TaxID=1524096 RepID=A0A4Y8S3K6_9SPHI|nr:hypothetical protein [Mucilaginibacter psychrotolerans]TFF33291.1 hypothetical protein E2R66_26800 [Mucilaginibacter psychrotolerans]
MKRLIVALKAFSAIMMNKDVSLTLRYGKKAQLNFEKGCFAEASDFLNTLKKRDNFPDHILNQYKEVLTDYNYKTYTNN